MKNKLFLRLKDLVQKENRARLAVLLHVFGEACSSQRCSGG